MQWNETTLGKFCPFTYGKAIKKQEQLSEGVPVYGSNGIYTHSKTELVGPYAVIIGRKGSVGKLHLSQVPCWVSDTAFYIEYECLEEAYFTYYLLSKLGLEDMNTDAAVPGLNRENAHRLDIRIPKNSAERKHLVEPLINIDKKIQLNQQINQTLEHMAQAIFKSWFVDFEPVKAKVAAMENRGSEEDALLAAMQSISGKDAAALANLQTEHPEQYNELRTTAELFPSAMQDSELGEIPAGWEATQVGNIVKRLKPLKRYTKKQVSHNGKVPVFEQGADILMGFHDDEPGFEASAEKPIFIFGDHTCITHLSCQCFDISQNVIPLKGSIRPTIWTYYAIVGKQAFQEYRRHWSEFIIKPVILPPLELCQRFTANITDSLLLMESLGREIKHLEKLRDSLLPKVLSGEFSVTDDAPQLAEVANN